MAPLLYNLGIIFGAVVLAERWGVHGLAGGVVLGSIGHLLVQLPALRAVGMRWRPSFEVASEGVREVLRLMGPRVLGLAAAQVNLVVVVFFASYVSDEAISAVNFAFLMMLLPVGVIGMAISTAAFPVLARQGAAGELERLGWSVDATLRDDPVPGDSRLCRVGAAGGARGAAAAAARRVRRELDAAGGGRAGDLRAGGVGARPRSRS